MGRGVSAEMEVTKSFRFEAAHSLPLLPDGHKCKRLHGHSYEVIVGCKGPLEPTLQWVVDYARISMCMKPLIDMVDHHNLNEVMDTDATTAEALALWFWERLAISLPWLSVIEVRETPTSNVILRKC